MNVHGEQLMLMFQMMMIKNIACSSEIMLRLMVDSLDS